MKRVRISWQQALAIFLLTPFLVTGVALGQSSFELGFDAPAELSGEDGATVQFSVLSTLTQSGVTPGDAVCVGKGQGG